MSELIDRIAKERYIRGNEKNMDDVYKRVARAVAENVPDPVPLYRENEDGISHSMHADRWYNVFYKLMAKGIFLPNTPTLSNAGTDNEMLSACFGLPVNDSFFETGGIMDGVTNSVRIMKMGGGVGYNFSNLRPSGSPVSSTDGVASGPVSFMKFYNAAVDVVKQGGRRRGAAIGILNVDHPDIKEFLTCKKEEGQIANMNLSVMVTDQFMRDVTFGDHERDLYRHANNEERVRKNIEIYNMIIDGIWHNGEPGLLFRDTINETNPNKHLYDIHTTNPCGEIPIGVNPATGGGEACNLGSINVSKFYTTTGSRIDYDELGMVVYSAVVFLDTIISMNNYPTDAIGEMTRSTRKIGLGFMGLHDLLIKMNRPYDSQEGRNVAENLMKFINDVAHITSTTLAGYLGVYPEWEGSHFNTDVYPRKKIRNSTLTCVAPTGTLSILAECSSGIEPHYNWVYERRNTVGSTFMMCVPAFEEAMKEVATNLTDGDITKILYRDFDIVVFDIRDEHVNGNNKWLIRDDCEEAPGDIREKLVDCIKQYCFAKGTIKDLYFIPKEVRDLFKNAMDINWVDHIKMQSYVQKYCDNSISKTVNMPSNATKDDVREAILLAWRMKCKGFTMYRDGSRQDVVLSLKDKETDTSEFPEGETDPSWVPPKEFYDAVGCSVVVPANNPNVVKAEVKVVNESTGSKFKRMLPASRFRVTSGCGDLYIHVAEDDGRVREVFVSCSGSGGCAANNNAIGRLISLALKNKVPIRDIIRQLKKVECSACLKNGSAEGKSCADIIGRVIEVCIPAEEEKSTPSPLPISKANQPTIAVISEERKTLKGLYCPECGSEVITEGRCYTCQNCGYSKCG